MNTDFKKAIENGTAGEYILKTTRDLAIATLLDAKLKYTQDYQQKYIDEKLMLFERIIFDRPTFMEDIEDMVDMIEDMACELDGYKRELEV